MADVYKVSHAQIPNVGAIAKIEDSQNHNFLFQEYFVYSVLHARRRAPGFAWAQNLYEEGGFRALVLQRLGNNLMYHFNYFHRSFSLKTLCMIAIQCLYRLEYLHHCGFIHRDIKPTNFATGASAKGLKTVYLLDFGFATRYTNLGKHVEHEQLEDITGSSVYMSPNAHYGMQQSRRDDLISLGYMLVEFARGELPWSDLSDDMSDVDDRMAHSKVQWGVEELCKGLHPSLHWYMTHVTRLAFSETPNYAKLRSFFKVAMYSRGSRNNSKFDWYPKK